MYLQPQRKYPWNHSQVLPTCHLCTWQQVTEQHILFSSYLLCRGSLNTACASRVKPKMWQAELICGLDKHNSIPVRVLHRMYRCLQTWKGFAFSSQAIGAKFRCESEFSNSGGSLSWCVLHLLPPLLVPGVHYTDLDSLKFGFHLCSLKCTQAHIHQPQHKSLGFLHELWTWPSKAAFKELKEVLS